MEESNTKQDVSPKKESENSAYSILLSVLSGKEKLLPALTKFLNAHPQKRGCYVAITITAWAASWGIYQWEQFQIESVLKEKDRIVHDSKAHIDSVSKERDGLRYERDKIAQDRDKHFLALQPWQSLAAKLEKDALPSERLDKLFERFQSMLEMLKQLDPSNVSFAFELNGREIPDGPSSDEPNGVTNTVFTPVLIKRGEPVVVMARNLGQFAAEQVTISFLGDIAATNLISNDWAGQPPLTVWRRSKEGAFTNSFIHRDTVSQRSIASRGAFQAYPLVFSSNAPPVEFDAWFTAYAARSKKQTFYVRIKLE